MLGFGLWLIEERATGRAIGEIGFQELKRDTEPSYAGEAEVGWILLPGFHGKGLAREALDAALAWGDRHIRAKGTVCIIHPENQPSIRLAQAVGYVRRTDISYKRGTWVLFDRALTAAG
jgi:RimJ/RimL family protein N-acetyltransferase